MEIRGKGVLITGASRGLGAALARQLASQGARLVLVARGGQAVEDLAAELRAGGADAQALAADLGDKQAIYKIAGAAAALVGPLRLLVHNASELGPVPLRSLLDTECEDFERVLQVNLLGPFRLSKALLGPMLLRKQGLVLHISSDAAVAGYPGWGPYGVSKAALDHLCRVWAAELEGSGLRLLSLDPGEMDTQMHADAMPEADRSTLARPEEVARAIANLIRDAESHPSGSRLEVPKLARPGVLP